MTLKTAITISAQARTIAKDILRQLRGGAQTANNIATTLKMSKSTVTRWLILLHKEGWVEKAALTRSRINLWTITIAGRQALEIL